MAAFDADDNGLLDMTELGKWKAMGEEMMKQWSWTPSADQMARMEQAWMDAQVDNNPENASLIEVAKFIANTWNVFLS